MKNLCLQRTNSPLEGIGIASLDNDPKKYVVNMKKEELEEWYDETYELLLFAFLFDEQVTNRAPKIKELKEKL